MNSSFVLAASASVAARVCCEGMKSRFYELAGFDPVKGIPTKEVLEEYGMAEEAKKVW